MVLGNPVRPRLSSAACQITQDGHEGISVKRPKNKAEILLWQHLQEVASKELWSIGKEYQFAPPRRWKFDFMVYDDCPKMRLGIEIEGGAWIKCGGAHNRGQGFIDDMEKYNHAALMGYLVLRFTPQQVLNGEAIAFIQRVLGSRDDGGVPRSEPIVPKDTN
jgi:very-short-patch-repair endonuclease